MARSRSSCLDLSPPGAGSGSPRLPCMEGGTRSSLARLLPIRPSKKSRIRSGSVPRPAGVGCRQNASKEANVLPRESLSCVHARRLSPPTSSSWSPSGSVVVRKAPWNLARHSLASMGRTSETTDEAGMRSFCGTGLDEQHAARPLGIHAQSAPLQRNRPLTFCGSRPEGYDPCQCLAWS